MAEQCVEWIKNGIDVHNFMTPFHGKFEGIKYSSNTPPAKLFQNANNTKNFEQFISHTIIERLRSGAIRLWGEVSVVDPPHLVSPLTVESKKPRLCIDLRYLNCWMRDIPFSLDSLSEIPRLTQSNSFMSKLDDKSGYDHVAMSSNSWTYLGFKWKKWYFVCVTLPFGWKESAYIYQTLNLQPIHYLRRLGIPTLLYIDDRWIGELQIVNGWSGEQRAKAAIFITARLLISLGYFLGIDKSILIPVKQMIFLGLVVDTKKQAFLLPQEKKENFLQLQRNILGKKVFSVRLLQKFVGKCVSFIPAVPAAKLYTSQCNIAIAKAAKSFDVVHMTEELKQEVSHWNFLESWKDFLPWRSEAHATITISTDASGYKWAGVLKEHNICSEFSDYFPEQDMTKNIMVKEALALKQTLVACGSKIKNCRVDARVDNKVLIDAWNSQGSRHSALNEVIKDIFHIIYQGNTHLSLLYVPSIDNVADAPSRMLNKSDAMLSLKTWTRIQQIYGGKTGHSFDLMALDSNCQRSLDNTPLPHFTPFKTPASNGVNVFSQNLTTHENYYVFPPLALVSPLAQFLKEQGGVRCTFVTLIPEMTPHWYPVVHSMAVSTIVLGNKGEKGFILYPSKQGFKPDKKGLPCQLSAFRFDYLQPPLPYPVLPAQHNTK